MSEPNLRAAVGGNNPPMADLLAIHYEAAVLAERNGALLADADALGARCTALAEVGDEYANRAAAALVRDIRALSTRVTACKELEKRPLLTAGASVETFIKAAADPLDAHKKRLERLIGGFAARKAEEERVRREAEAAELRRQADARAEAARQAEAAGSATAASLIMDSAVKTERLAEVHASATTHELARSRTDEGSTGLKVEWTDEIVNAEAMKATLGPLRDCFTLDAINAAIRKFRMAEVAAGRDPVLPGVKFTKGFTGNVR